VVRHLVVILEVLKKPLVVLEVQKYPLVALEVLKHPLVDVSVPLDLLKNPFNTRGTETSVLIPELLKYPLVVL